MLKEVRHFAIQSPACSAVVSKATPILAAVSVNVVSSSAAIPAVPADAVIAARSSAAMGMSFDIWTMESDMA